MPRGVDSANYYDREPLQGAAVVDQRPRKLQRAWTSRRLDGLWLFAFVAVFFLFCRVSKNQKGAHERELARDVEVLRATRRFSSFFFFFSF